MENEILKRQNLLMKYDLNSTLTENLDNINDVLLEQGIVRDVVMGGGIAARELEGVLKTMMKDTKIANELKNVSLTDAKGLKTGVRTAEELANAIKLNKLSSSLRGELELAILKSRTTNKSLIDAAASNLTRNKQFLSKYSTELAQGQVAYEKALKNAGYSEDAITSIVKQTENLGGKIKSAEDILNATKETKIRTNIKGEESLTPAKEQALNKESWMQKQRDRFSKYYSGGKGKVDKVLKNKWIERGFLKANGKISKRKLLAWAAVIGVGYYVLKSWLEGQGIQEESLTTQEKLDRAKKCGYKTWEEYKVSGWKCSKKGGEESSNSGGDNNKPNIQRPNVQDIIKQIQQNLNQEQTGQFTTKDIQDIIIKLGGKAESPAMTEEINRIRMIMNLVVEQVDLDSIIKQNVKSDIVIQLQELLKTKYNENIVVDGYLGPKTANALLNSLSKIPTNVNQTNTTQYVVTQPDTNQPDTTQADTNQPERLQTVSAVDAAKGLKPTGTLRGT
jgi:hypothetical protein